MKQSLFRHNDFSFSHQLDEPFISWFCMAIDFTITTQIPWIHNFNCTIGNSFKMTRADRHSFTSTKLSVAHLFSSLLRFTNNPTIDRGAFFTSTHIVSNVMSGHFVSLCHSVKHYETMVFNRFFIIS